MASIRGNSAPPAPPPAPPVPAQEPPPPRRASRSRRAVVAALALLARFAGLAWFAVDTKAPTYDEPLHALGAWLHLHHRDFRVNPEDPPLWHYWAALPNGPGAIRADLTTPD